ncbi:FRG1-like family protein [Fonsecaea pedrosoi]|nr:FRG1-like family protein [Fonsecaea pedrosoi]
MPIKPLTFKGDKKPKKRKHRHDEDVDDAQNAGGQPAVDPSDDDSWTTPDEPSDLSGPVVLVLPTTPPTALAADAHGNVFASPLENIVEGVAETAEPHDVRQVWVASSVAGLSKGELSFKGSHGGYLSCDSVGVLGAKREARGVEEGFVAETVDNAADGKTRWRLRTAASKSEDGDKGRRYLCAVTETKQTNAKSINISLRGDGEASSESTHLVFKMQARFKPRLQQNKETKAKEKVSRRELEQAVGRRLEEHEVKRLKKAKKEGNFYEEVLDVRVKGKHDKFAS